MHTYRDKLLFYSQLILILLISLILITYFFSISVFAAPLGDSSYIMDTEPSYIESRDTSLSDTTPGQVSFSALLPEGFGFNAFSIIENTQTNQLYRCIFYSSNDYKDTIFLPVGTYEVIECSIFDDTTAKYSLTIPDDFAISHENKVVELTTQLVDFDLVADQIENNIANPYIPDDHPVSSIISSDLPNNSPDDELLYIEQPLSDFDIDHKGIGVGGIAITGKQLHEFDKLIFKIINSGNVPNISVVYSLDNGITWSDIHSIPLSGYLRLPNTGLTAEFYAPADVDTAFISGDTYSAYISDPKEHINISQGNASLAKLSIESINPDFHVFDILEQHSKDIVVAVTKSGTFGSSVIRVSIDGGKTIYKEMYVPVDGVISISELGLNLIFSANPNNERNFSEGDVFIISAFKDSNAILIFIAAFILLTTICVYYIIRKYYLSMIDSPINYSLCKYTRYENK